MSRSRNSRKGSGNFMSERGHGRFNHIQTERPNRRADHVLERAASRGADVDATAFSHSRKPHIYWW